MLIRHLRCKLPVVLCYLFLTTHCLHCSFCRIFMYIAVICAEVAPALQKYKLIPFSDKVRTVCGQSAGLEPPISLPCSTVGFLCHYLSFQCDRSPRLKWGVISFLYLIINSEHPNPNRFTLTPSLSIANFYCLHQYVIIKRKKEKKIYLGGPEKFGISMKMLALKVLSTVIGGHGTRC